MVMRSAALLGFESPYTGCVGEATYQALEPGVEVGLEYRRLIRVVLRVSKGNKYGIPACAGQVYAGEVAHQPPPGRRRQVLYLATHATYICEAWLLRSLQREDRTTLCYQSMRSFGVKSFAAFAFSPVGGRQPPGASSSTYFVSDVLYFCFGGGKDDTA